MTSWVLSIDADYPQHWAIAKKHGFWDLPEHRAITPGDLIYFWQSKGSFVAQARATSTSTALTPTMASSWEDSGVRTYRYRFEFELLDESPNAQPKWGEVKAQLSSNASPNVKPRYTAASDQAVLASFFASTPPLSPAELAAVSMLNAFGVAPPENDVGDLSDDERKIVKTYQVMRQGQEMFREALYKNYGACAITGTTVKQALDAAHIRPYSGPKSNVPHNGMPLRSDLHRLFDRHLVTVTLTDDGTYVVRVTQDLADTPYGELDGRTLVALPQQPSLRPSAELLAEHNGKCSAWLDS